MGYNDRPKSAAESTSSNEEPGSSAPKVFLKHLFRSLSIFILEFYQPRL